MSKIQDIKNRFLGIVFFIFTILIGVFALTEFLNLNPNISGKLAGSILTEFPKDSTNVIDEGKDDGNILSVNNSIERNVTQKDSLVKYSVLP